MNIYGKYLLLLAFAAVYFLSTVESCAEKNCKSDHTWKLCLMGIEGQWDNRERERESADLGLSGSRCRGRARLLQQFGGLAALPKPFQNHFKHVYMRQQDSSSSNYRMKARLALQFLCFLSAQKWVIWNKVGPLFFRLGVKMHCSDLKK